MARRKSRLTVADIGRLPLVKMPDQPRPSLKRFQQEEAREEEAARIAAESRRLEPLRGVEQELREAAREASARIAMYWRIPIEEIQMNPVSITRVDLAGDYEIGPRDEPAENAAWKEFQENLKSSGCTLSDAGLLRLSHYLSSLNYHRGISLTSVSNFAKALERLVSLDVFQPGELTGYRQTASKTTPEPERHAVIDPLAELEDLTLESRSGNARAKQIATNDFFGRQVAPIASQWREWLIATFNYVPTPEVQKAAGQWFLNNPTESPLSSEAWTRLRLNLIKKNVMPKECRLPEEILMESIESSSERSDSYEARRNLRQRIRELAHK
jgi:hypothetical protein